MVKHPPANSGGHTCGSAGKESTRNGGDLGLIPRLGRSPGEGKGSHSSILASSGDVREEGSIPRLGRSPGGGHGNPLQYSCLENPMDRGAWWATVHRVTKSLK